MDDGRIDTTDRGIAALGAWPRNIEQWRPLIDAAGQKHGIPPAWIAAVMAIETAGRPGLCARLSDGSCAQNEGAGLMAILPSTASDLAGRSVTSDELMADNALSVDLGAKYIVQNLRNPRTGGSFPGGDYVFAAISYNAGSVRCGTGHVWRPAGSGLPRTACPPTSWGVVQGCVESKGGIIVSDYPRRAILAANAAMDHGFDGGGGAGPVLVAGTGGGGGRWFLFALAAAGGYVALNRYRKRRGR